MGALAGKLRRGGSDKDSQRKERGELMQVNMAMRHGGGIGDGGVLRVYEAGRVLGSAIEGFAGLDVSSGSSGAGRDWYHRGERKRQRQRSGGFSLVSNAASLLCPLSLSIPDTPKRAWRPLKPAETERARCITCIP